MKTSTFLQLIIVILLFAGTIYTLTHRDSHLGLDLSGGASLTYSYTVIPDEEGTPAEKTKIKELEELEKAKNENKNQNIDPYNKVIETDETIKAAKVSRAITTINNRLDPSGAEGVIVHTVAKERIEVQVPAVKGKTPEESLQKTKAKIDEIKRKMDIPGQLSFWFEVDDENDKRPEIKSFEYNGNEVRLEFRFKDGVVFSAARLDAQSNHGWVVDIKFDSLTGQKFFELTRDASETKRKTAIVLDGKVITMLNSDFPITGGSCYIHGGYTEATATDMAKILLSGSLPIKLKLEQEYNVGPTLGKDSIEQSKIAIIVGASAILAFMGIYYHIAGIIAIIALVLNIALILVIMIYTNLVLTLPGIAGLLLTMGMAVDANILIYERIREELAQGKSAALAVYDGFDRAFTTIFDSNLTTIITGIILFNVGTSALKGFATTLIIGLIVSMFTALFVSKVFFKVLLDMNLVKTFTMFKIFGKTTFPFMKFGKASALVSFAIIVVGMAVLFAKGDKMLDVDFKGGISVMIQLEKPLESEDVRKKMATAGYENVLIQNIDDNVTFEAHTAYSKYNFRFDAEHGKLAAAKDVDSKMKIVKNDLIQTFGLNEATGIVSINNVGPDVAHDLQIKAIIAILSSMIAILLYVRIRFSDFAFGAGACLALLHDVLIAMSCIGFWSLLPTGGRIDLNIVAALLTIVGFSINDTIVVFDRIRENLLVEKARFEASLKDPNIQYTPLPRAEIFNQAINQTLSRTIWTSMTVFVATLSLFLFGGAVIHGFAFTMLVGVIFGTYSSIFIASPITVYLQDRIEKKRKLLEQQVSTTPEANV